MQTQPARFSGIKRSWLLKQKEKNCNYEVKSDTSTIYHETVMSEMNRKLLHNQGIICCTFLTSGEAYNIGNVEHKSHNHHQEVVKVEFDNGN